MSELTRDRIILAVYEACADLDECYPAGEARKLAQKVVDRLVPTTEDLQACPAYVGTEFISDKLFPKDPLTDITMQFARQPKPEPYVDPDDPIHVPPPSTRTTCDIRPDGWNEPSYEPQKFMNPEMIHNPPIYGPDDVK